MVSPFGARLRRSRLDCPLVTMSTTSSRYQDSRSDHHQIAQIMFMLIGNHYGQCRLVDVRGRVRISESYLRHSPRVCARTFCMEQIQTRRTRVLFLSHCFSGHWKAGRLAPFFTTPSFFAPQLLFDLAIYILFSGPWFNLSHSRVTSKYIYIC